MMIRTIRYPLTLIAAAAALLWALPPRAAFETEILIQADPAAVWAVLSDAEGHPGWNPSLTAVSGRFAVGERPRLDMPTPSGGTMTFRPTVLVAEPGRELRWRGRLWLPRLFDGEHYFVLEPVAGGTRLRHGEGFRGVLLWLIDVHQFRPAFEATNAALKARVEGLAAAGR